VEHGITEMITGIDLISWQLAIANGEGLSLTQMDVVSNGASIECRIYAEDPRLAFRPSTGRLHGLRFPAATSSVRIDSGFREGDSITPHYDPLIAKIMTHGGDRRNALSLMERALDEVLIEGVKTNMDVLRRTIRHQAFVVPGHVHTGFLAEHSRDLALT
jgi:3-methylcrotonyl-CoA carboxylase alpha subunit